MSVLKYVTSEDMADYIKQRPSFTGTPEQLASMVNFFAEGAVTGLSNFLYEQIAENGNTLYHGLQNGCRCGSCYEWQIIDEDHPNLVLESADSMTEWVTK